MIARVADRVVSTDHRAGRNIFLGRLEIEITRGLLGNAGENRRGHETSIILVGFRLRFIEQHKNDEGRIFCGKMRAR